AATLSVNMSGKATKSFDSDSRANTISQLRPRTQTAKSPSESWVQLSTFKETRFNDGLSAAGNIRTWCSTTMPISPLDARCDGVPIPQRRAPGPSSFYATLGAGNIMCSPVILSVADEHPKAPSHQI